MDRNWVPHPAHPPQLKAYCVDRHEHKSQAELAGRPSLGLWFNKYLTEHRELPDGIQISQVQRLAGYLSFTLLNLISISVLLPPFIAIHIPLLCNCILLSSSSLPTLFPPLLFISPSFYNFIPFCLYNISASLSLPAHLISLDHAGNWALKGQSHLEKKNPISIWKHTCCCYKWPWDY